MLFPRGQWVCSFWRGGRGKRAKRHLYYIYYAGRLRWAESSPPAGGARRGAFLSPRWERNQRIARGTFRMVPRVPSSRPREKPRGGFPHWIFFPGTGDGRRNPRQRGMLSAAAESWEDYSWQKRRMYPPRIGKTAFRRADPGPETRDIAYAYRPDHNRWNGQDVHSGNWFVL